MSLWKAHKPPVASAPSGALAIRFALFARLVCWAVLVLALTPAACSPKSDDSAKTGTQAVSKPSLVSRPENPEEHGSEVFHVAEDGHFKVRSANGARAKVMPDRAAAPSPVLYPKDMTAAGTSGTVLDAPGDTALTR